MLQHRASFNWRTARHSTPRRHHLYQNCPHRNSATSFETQITRHCNIRQHPETPQAVTDDARPTASSANTTAAAPDVSTTSTPAPWRIYVGKMPLAGFETIAAALKGTPAHQLMQLHTYVLLEGPGQVWYFDFLPLNPTSPATALTLLTAGSTPGEFRERKLSVTCVQASNTVRLLGLCKHPDPLAAAKAYSRSFNTQLHLVHNSCQQYTDGLIKVLLKPCDVEVTR